MIHRTMIALAASSVAIMAASGCKKSGDTAGENKAGAGDMAKAGSGDMAKAGSGSDMAKAGSGG